MPECMKSQLYISLIHYPVLNKAGKTVTTSVTNLDIHDLARTGRTYGVRKVFIVTPSAAQQGMVCYIKNYWTNGFGASYNPHRREAFDIVEVAGSLDDVCLTIKKLGGKRPQLVATSARRLEGAVSFCDVSALVKQGDPVLVLFGTGFGLTPEFLQGVTCVLEPIRGESDYNHLPVRSAVAIVLDRLFYERH